MRRRIVLIFSFLVVLGLLGYFGYKHFVVNNSEEVVANVSEQKNEKETEDNYPIYYDMPTDKEWLISFDEPLNANSITNESVYVLDENENPVTVNVSLQNNNQSVSIKAPNNGYTKGSYYELYMNDSISYTDNETVSKSFKLGFFIARDKVEEVVFNKNIIAISSDKIISDENNVLTLDNKQVNEELKKGDILRIPSDHEVYEEKAIKILNVEENKNEIKIIYEQPKFQELFEKINIYEKYNLAGDDVIFIPEKDVEMNKIASIEPTTLIAASGSKKAKKGGEFQLTPTENTKVEASINNGFEFSIKNLELDIEGEKTVVSGKIKMLNPETIWDFDMDFFKLKRLNAQIEFSNFMEVEQKLEIEKFKKKFGKSWQKKMKKRKWTNDQWQVEKEIRLGTVYLPIVPGVFVEGNISGVLGLNLLTGETTFELKHFVTSQQTTKFGIMKKKSGFKPVFDHNPDLDAGVYVKGSADGKLSGEFQVGITALEVIGVALEAEGGGFASGEGFLGGSNDGNIACYKYDYGFLLGGGVILEALLKDELASLKIKELRFLLDYKNTCENLKDIVVTPEKITAKPGDVVELEIKGTYRDETNGTEYKKNLLIGKKNYKKLDISTSDVESVDVSLKETKKSVPVLGTAEASEKGIKIKYKSDKIYKASIKVPKEPINETVIVTVEYDGKFKKEIPIKLEGVVKEVPKEEAKKIISDLMNGIVSTYRNLGSKYNWDNRTNPADFSILKPELLKYATQEYTESGLKELAAEYYCQCDIPFFPMNDFDVRFKIHENTGKKIVASSIEFVNEMGNGGNTVYYTAVKKDGKWLIDSWKYVSYEQEPMKVTWEEVETYEKNMGNKVELLNETTHNNQKVYILRYPDSNFIRGVYADSTEFLWEVPLELLPPELRNVSLDGNWNIQNSGINGTLSIKNSTEDKFDFSINVVSSGGHVGDLSGTASKSGNSATFTEDEYGCKLDFSINNNNIIVSESFECLNWHGAGVAFDGDYKKE